MKKVANRKLIRTLSYRTMKEKKWKNLIAVMAIALTTVLFTALFTVGMSLIDSMQEATMRQVGTSAHGGYKYMSREEYERIRQAGGYREIAYDIVVGFAANPELNTIQTEVRFAQDQMAEWSFSYPEEGKMPKTGKECAASSKVLEALGIPLTIGAEVPLTIQSHNQNGEEVIIEETFTLCGYWYSNEASRAQEFWVSEEWMQEHVAIEERSFRERSLEGIVNAEGTYQVNVMLDSSFDIEKSMTELSERAGFGPEEVRESVNWAYAASKVDAMSVLMGIALIGIVIFSGYLIIYNIFYINVTVDIRYYGLLKTIGTTGRQLKRLVRRQAFLLAAAGIPIGLFLGWFVGKGLLPFIYQALETSQVRNVVLNPWIFAGSACFALLVVYISCIKPCRLAARVSPVEAVRYTENGEYRKKQKKTGRVSMARMAFSNMGRNRKKTVLVVTSLSLSLILLNATYTLVKGFSFEKYVSSYLIADMQVSHFSDVNMSAANIDYEAVTPEFLADASAIEGVEEIYTPWERDGKLHMKEEDRAV